MKIVIDAGHGGHDSGAVARDGTKEKDLVLAYAKDLREILQKKHKVLMTRVNDDFVGLSLRATRANAWDADCFISLHANASVHKSANGAWVIYDDDTVSGIKLSSEIWRAMATVPGVVDADPDEEVYPDNSPWVGNRELTVVSDTNMPAALVELGFLTNEGDLADMKNHDIRNQICVAIAKGIERWAFMEGLYEPPIEFTVEETFATPHVPIRVVEAWKRPALVVVKEEAFVGEASGSFALRQIKNMVDSPEATEALSGVRAVVLRVALKWLEDLLVKLVGVGDGPV